MMYQVRVVHVNEVIEEEVAVEVGQQVLTCFATVCPYAITAGQFYWATLSLWSADGLELSETSDEAVGITRIGDGFRHRVVGVLNGAVLDAGMAFDDELFRAEYGYWDGRLVALEVDRIQIAFE